MPVVNETRVFQNKNKIKIVSTSKRTFNFEIRSVKFKVAVFKFDSQINGFIKILPISGGKGV